MMKPLSFLFLFVACTHTLAPLKGKERRAAAARANAAYDRKDFDSCAAEATKASDHSTAACCFALAGKKTEAFEQLERAAETDATLTVDWVNHDEDLASLRTDSRWPSVQARFAAANARLNSELLQLYAADQADRQDPSSMDWAQVSERDRQRKARVNEIVAAGGARVSADYFNAAMVYQHGGTPADALRSHELALKAVELDAENARAKWLAAASEDRRLMYEGKPQKWGTQYSRETASGVMKLWPVDGSITDEQRDAMNVPTLEEARAKEAQMQLAAPSQ